MTTIHVAITPQGQHGLDACEPLSERILMPVVLYGCEVRAHEGMDVVEKVHLKCCKYILSQMYKYGIRRVRNNTSAVPCSKWDDKVLFEQY